MWIFRPILKQMIWGGNKILSFRNLTSDLTNIGESWEISGLPGHETIVAEGSDEGLTLKELIKKYGTALLGENNFKKYGDRFPVLVKIIDAGNDLSVQVHPDDKVALDLGADKGKNEMWFFLKTDDESFIIDGFNKDISYIQCEDLLYSGNINSILNEISVKEGDAFFIPSGRVHAIGKGSMLVEIQETSDVTFRLYDYDRKDHNGHPRDLHIKEGLKAIDFNSRQESRIDYNQEAEESNLLSHSSFTINLLKTDKPLSRNYKDRDSFVILTCIGGTAAIEDDSEKIIIKPGESVLIPASCKKIFINPESSFKALETYI